jgi:AbrB family looped-hinge helix DNA binding protein
MSKGQVTIPKEIRTLLNVGEGDKVTFISRGDYAVVMNANLYATRTHKDLSRFLALDTDKTGFQQQQRKAVYTFLSDNNTADSELTDTDYTELESGKFKLNFGYKELDI